MKKFTAWSEAWFSTRSLNSSDRLTVLSPSEPRPVPCPLLHARLLARVNRSYPASSSCCSPVDGRQNASCSHKARFCSLYGANTLFPARVAPPGKCRGCLTQNCRPMSHRRLDGDSRVESRMEPPVHPRAGPRPRSRASPTRRRGSHPVSCQELLCLAVWSRTGATGRPGDSPRNGEKQTR